MDARGTPGNLDPAPPQELDGWLAKVSAGAMSRREFVVRAAALGLSASSVGALLAACGKKKDTVSASPMDTTLPDELVIYNWQYYMSPKALKGFEKQTGMRCRLVYFGGPEEIAPSIEAGKSYDVAFPNDMWVQVLIGKGLLQPLDVSLIPNFDKYVTQQFFRAPSFDPGTDGKKYSTPYMFGTTGFAARLDEVPEPSESWGALWDKKYKGSIAMLNTSRDALGEALFLLGYSPNTTSQDELDQATKKLIEQKPLVKVYDSDQPKNSIIGGCAFTNCWDGDAIAATKKLGLSKVRYVLPTEGYTIWMDGVCIPKTAKSPYAAHLFLNYLLEPEVAAENANYLGYEPVVEAADPLIKDMVQRAMRPTPEVLDRGVFAEDLGDFNAAYEKAWEKVKSA
jgi:spermidine/putrescine transport system substrate-binding protein